MKTNFESLTQLSRYVLDHLVSKNHIEFAIDSREKLIDSLATELSVSFATEDDIRQQVLEEIEDKLGETDIDLDELRETEMFGHVRKEIIRAFNGEVIAGLYMVESLYKTAERIRDWLLDSDQIEDVYSPDEELISFLVQKIRNYTP